MIETALAPDWAPFKFEQGRFDVIHSLLNDFEKRISREGAKVNRSEYLAQCHTENERNIMSQEMDYLCALQSQPVKFVGGCLIIRTVAVGGFGVVSLGVDQDGRSVAVKVSHLSWQLAKNRDELDEEAMILKELSHPNIVEFISCGYDDDWYLITEWVNGYNLRDAIEKIRAPLVQWLDIFCQACDALEYGHGLGIIHRDINPRNIMVTGDGKPVVKVLDYGVAKRINLAHSNSEHIKGTRKFIAPEQYNGKCDERSDLYALGVTLQEVVQSQYSHPGRVPRQLRSVINKATARKPSKRYQTAGEFRSAIQNVNNRISSGDYPIADQRNHSLVLSAVCMMIVSVALVWTLIGKGLIFNPFMSSVAENPVILLKTDPPDARLTFYRLRKEGPDPAGGINVGTERTTDEIPQGDYLVVAIWPDGEWIEVLRRIPALGRTDPLPSSPFDAFRSGPLGVEIAPIKKVSFQKSGMVATSEFWIDTQVTDESDKQESLSSFGYACETLEALGKRLPFAPELESYRGPGQIEASMDEWTCTLGSESTIARTLPNKLETTFQVNHYIVIPAGIGSNPYQLKDYLSVSIRPLGFRGIRRLSPFGTSGY